MFARRSKAKARAEALPYDRFLEHFRPLSIPIPGASPEALARCEASLGAPLPASLKTLLTRQNGGFYAGGTLHLLGAGRERRHDDLCTWNHSTLWKASYQDPKLEPYLFFADDVFGNQFGMLLGEPEPSVIRFDIQEGEFTHMADSLPHFLGELLVGEGQWLLGHDYLEAYRAAGLPWQVSEQLAYLSPSLLGGSMTPDNLHPIDPPSHLHVVGQMVAQIKPLPPGKEVRGFKVDQETMVVSVKVSAR